MTTGGGGYFFPEGFRFFQKRRAGAIPLEERARVVFPQGRLDARFNTPMYVARGEQAAGPGVHAGGQLHCPDEARLRIAWVYGTRGPVGGFARIEMVGATTQDTTGSLPFGANNTVTFHQRDKLTEAEGGATPAVAASGTITTALQPTNEFLVVAPAAGTPLPIWFMTAFQGYFLELKPGETFNWWHRTANEDVEIAMSWWMVPLITG